MARKLTSDIFIARARQLYGDKYDYSKVAYVNAVTKITITCPEHGDFCQSPARFLHDNLACKACASAAKASSVSAFIAKAKAVHGDQYDYRLVKYSDNHTAVTIVCPQHGPFQLLPNSHLGGRGCRFCSAVRYASS